MACGFVAGLPEDVRQLLRAVSRMEALKLDQILSRARPVLKDNGVPSRSEACFGAVSQATQCFKCISPNHFGNDYQARRRLVFGLDDV